MNSADFRDALAHFASGVTVVTARAAIPSGTGHALVGFTATSFTSVSLSPPLVLVCVSHTASAHDGFVHAELFAVNVLAQGQVWIAEQFARKNVDRFEGVPLVVGGRAPLIEGAIAHLECRPHSRIEAGDHTVVFGEVLEAQVHANAAGKRGPLLYYARRFAGLEREGAAPASSDAIGAAEGGEG
jgi:flavin reductase ActVB